MRMYACGCVRTCRNVTINNWFFIIVCGATSQTFKFEEIQNLRFEVYDVDTDFKSADASSIDLAKQVVYVTVITSICPP